LIQGDFDNATLSQRTRLQTSTVNATTGVYVVPNGTATSASVQISNAADPTNASKLVVATNASTDTQIVSGANGSGSYLPLSFYTNNDIRFQMGNDGELNVRTAPGTVSSGTSGQFLTSGGPGAGVSWTTAAGGFSNMQVFASPGTFTTPSTTTKIKVTVVGGGGSGGNNATAGGAGGGGGGAAIYVGPVSASTPYAVTVGSAGGTSSFGALASATGGSNGTPAGGLAGVGGAGSAGTLQISGCGGGVGTGPGPSGAGGASLFGGAGRGVVNNTAGAAGSNYGGGGGGAAGSGPGVFSGGTGAGGVVVVEW
jgi:hypothetical protein